MFSTFNIDDVKKILLAEGYISTEDAAQATKASANAPEQFFSYLVEKNVLNKTLLGQSIAQSFSIPFTDLDANQPSKEEVLKTPENVAREHRFVVLHHKKGLTTIATDRPQDAELIPAVQEVYPGKVTVTYAPSEDIDTVLRFYAKPLDTRFSKIIASSARIAPEILDEIFSDAISLHASDIHFEPRPTDIEVRFRIDGILHEAGRIPKEYYENILNRLKVLAHERLDEHRSAQDGALRFEKDGISVDMRSSIIPTINGEKVVLRVLLSYAQGLTLSDLGLSTQHAELIEKAASRPFGMIIVTGPTGSGKTTTLYALLKKINSSEVNITTIEDPVEYKVEGVNQIQVDVATNLTFAKGLRSIVRQDPDIILVGEIRDAETAEIAVNASLTGHLLLSTFHANDAATAIPRLLDMKIEPFLLSSTLTIVVAQRLIRKICPQCKHSVETTKKKILKKYPGLKDRFPDDAVTLYAGKGCSTCNETGFKGQMGIFECISVTPELQELILKNPSSQEIWALASTQGSRHLFEDGFEKVVNGITTLEELARVAEFPS
jgi:type IV pilus assembly protein PilB